MRVVRVNGDVCTITTSSIEGGRYSAKDNACKAVRGGGWSGIHSISAEFILYC